jgi:uncharacterized protein (DUF1697 family)
VTVQTAPVVFIALLRGVNVGGRGLVAMTELRRLATDLGFVDVKSVLQSGNLVFRGAAQPTGDLERTLEAATRESLGLDTAFLVRTAGQWQELLAANPFPEAAERDPSRLLVMFLKSAPPADRVAALEAAVTGRELVAVSGSHAYLVYPEGVGRSKLTGSLIERRLGTEGTARNWNTVGKLAALTDS